MMDQACWKSKGPVLSKAVEQKGREQKLGLWLAVESDFGDSRCLPQTVLLLCWLFPSSSRSSQPLVS